MGLIEQAAKRLEELRRAGAATNPRAAPEAAPTAHSRAARLTLDLAKLAAEGFVTPDLPRSRIADEFRVIKRPLIANATGKGAAQIRHGNLIMVTSAVPGEGKSFCALNLAMSIAMEQDRTVLLVDADVVRPSLPRTFAIADSPGLLDVLSDRSVDLGQVLHRPHVEKRTFASGGSHQARATEMLAS